VNAKQAKANRAVERVTAERDRLHEALAQAHDRLHKDDVDGCHDMLHQGLGSGELVSDVAPLSGLSDFDRRFRDLCLETGMRASYVAIDGRRLLSGGDAELDGIVTAAVRKRSA
jgi:hypothetical protein